MNELIKVNYDSDNITVSARELHEFLEVKTRYNDWFARMLDYSFQENVDYRAITQKRVTAQGNETAYIDHELTLDMAKELCMIQRNAKGKEARQYFLQLEKDWNSPEKVMARALQIANRTIEQCKQQIAELEPKAQYLDSILDSDELLTTTQIAKDYGMTAYQMNKLLHGLGVEYKQNGQWLLYAQHQSKGYMQSITQPIGNGKTKQESRWTQEGKKFIEEVLRKHGVLRLGEREG